MNDFSIRLKKYLFIVFAMTLFVGLVVGCSNSFTGSDADEPIGPVHIMSYYDYDEIDHIDEVWLIDAGDEGRSGLTIEEIISIIEENKGYFTIDNEADYELLKKFIFDSFENVQVIVGDEDIAETLRHVQFCCVYNPKTKRITVRVIVK